MLRSVHLWGGVVGIGLVALVGCAVGTEEEQLTEGTLASAPIEAGAEDDAPSVVLPPPSTEEEDEDAGTAAPDAGADAGGDAGGGGGGGGSCAATNTCMLSTDLGAVSGDKGTDVKTAEGSGSKWFKVRVTEDSSSVLGDSLEMKAELTSPAGANYDLYVYVPSSDTIECSAVTKSSTLTGTLDTAGVEFGEGGGVANGSDDDRTVTVEVRHASGPCDPAAKWKLTITGNTH